MCKTKKLITLLLSTAITLSLMTPLFSSFAAEEKYPIIYISGYGTELYAEKGNFNSECYYPTGADIGASVKEALEPCLTELTKALFTGDFSKYCDELYNSIAPIYENLVLAPDGTTKDNSGRGENTTGKVLLDYNRFSCGEKGFPYDWRLSPEYSGEELEKFVDKVIADTGKPKVNIVARCLGANVLSSYLQNGENITDKVNEVVFFIPSTKGINIIGAIFSGQIEIDAKNLDTYIESLLRYEEVFEDTSVKDFIVVTIAVLEQIRILHMGTNLLQELLDEIKYNLLPRILRSSYGSFPSFWAMIPEEYFEAALRFVYNTPELQQEYAGTIEKARSYHENVLLNSDKRLTELKENIDINVISKYNVPLMPLFEDSFKNGDGTAETFYTSFGATAADYGETLSSWHISNISEENKVYLSPDEVIDASTCLFPENTWFIKNSFHDHFPDSIDRLIDKILTTDMTVFTDESYPQFMEHILETDTLIAVEGKDEEPQTEGYFQKTFRLIKEFFLKLFELMSEYFSKETTEAA